MLVCRWARQVACSWGSWGNWGKDWEEDLVKPLEAFLGVSGCTVVNTVVGSSWCASILLVGVAVNGCGISMGFTSFSELTAAWSRIL